MLHQSPKDRILAELQERIKMGGRVQPQDVGIKPRSSDSVESMKMSVKWEPQSNALGIQIPPEEATLPAEELAIVSNTSFPHYNDLTELGIAC